MGLIANIVLVYFEKIFLLFFLPISNISMYKLELHTHVWESRA